jgi:hypothetical protein
MALFNIEKFHVLANNDPEFLIAARFWNTFLKLEMGDSVCVLKIEEGRIASVNLSPSMCDAWNIRISGPAEDWKKILEPIPPPFYQDIFAASVYHNLSYEGDMESMFAYYPAIRRMAEIMRECATM